MAARGIHEWFDEYGESHRNATNIAVHWIAVPLIFFSVIGLLSCITAIQLPYLGRFTVVGLALVVVFVFYIRLSILLAFGMLVFGSACLAIAHWLDVHSPFPLWAICITVFVVAWVAQFLGHNIEGKKPSFLMDLQFLMIGPAWLLAKLLMKMGINY